MKIKKTLILCAAFVVTSLAAEPIFNITGDSKPLGVAATDVEVVTLDNTKTKVLKFNGNSSKIQATKPMNLPKSFTFLFWCNSKTKQAKQGAILSKQGWHSAFYFNVHGQFMVTLATAQKKFKSFRYTHALQYNTWLMGAFTFDGTKGTIYLNGMPVAESDDIGALYNIKTPFVVGAASMNKDNNAYFNGMLNGVRVWPRVLNALEISKIFRAEKPLYIK